MQEKVKLNKIAVVLIAILMVTTVFVYTNNLDITSAMTGISGMAVEEYDSESVEEDLRKSEELLKESQELGKEVDEILERYKERTSSESSSGTSGGTTSSRTTTQSSLQSSTQIGSETKKHIENGINILLGDYGLDEEFIGKNIEIEIKSADGQKEWDGKGEYSVLIESKKTLIRVRIVAEYTNPGDTGLRTPSQINVGGASKGYIEGVSQENLEIYFEALEGYPEWVSSLEMRNIESVKDKETGITWKWANGKIVAEVGEITEAGPTEITRTIPIGTEVVDKKGNTYTFSGEYFVLIDDENKRVVKYNQDFKEPEEIDFSGYQGGVTNIDIDNSGNLIADFGGETHTVQTDGDGYRLKSGSGNIIYYDKDWREKQGSEDIGGGFSTEELYQYGNLEIPKWVAQDIAGENINTPTGQRAFRENYEKIRDETGSGLRDLENGNYVLGDILFLKTEQKFDLTGLSSDLKKNILKNSDEITPIGENRIIIENYEQEGRTLDLTKDPLGGWTTAVIREGERIIEEIESFGDDGSVTTTYNYDEAGKQIGYKKEFDNLRSGLEGQEYQIISGWYERDSQERQINGNYKEEFYDSKGNLELTIEKDIQTDEEGTRTVTIRGVMQTEEGEDVKEQVVTERVDGTTTATETLIEGNKKTITESQGKLDYDLFYTQGKITHQKIITTETVAFDGERGTIDVETIKEADGPAEGAEAAATKIIIRDKDENPLAELDIAEGSEKITTKETFINQIKTLSPETIERMVRDNGWSVMYKEGGVLKASDGREIKLTKDSSNNPIYSDSVSGFEVNGRIYTSDYVQKDNFVEYLRYIKIDNLPVYPNFWQDISEDGKEAVIYAYYTWKPYAVIKDGKIIGIYETEDGVEYYDLSPDLAKEVKIDITKCTDAACREAKKLYEDSKIGVNLERSFRLAVGATRALRLLGIKLSQWPLGKLIDQFLFVELFQDPGDVLCRDVFKKIDRQEFTDDGVIGYTSGAERYALLSAIKSQGIAVNCAKDEDCNSGYACNLNRVCQQGRSCQDIDADPRYGICPVLPVEFQKQRLYKVTFWLKAMNNDIPFSIYLHKEEQDMGTNRGLRIIAATLPAGKDVSSTDEGLFRGSVKYMEDDYEYVCFIFENGKLCNKIAEKTAKDAQKYATAAAGGAVGGTGDISWSW